MSETLSEVLHPEIILGRRGKESTVEQYKYSLSKVNFIEGQGWITELPMELAISPLMHHLLIAKKFITEKPPVYRLGKDFGSVLAEIDNDIPVDKLPDNFFGFISLPEGVVSDDTGNVHGAYVFIGDAKYTALHPENYGKKIMWISTIGDAGKGVKFDEYGEKDFTVSHVLIEPKGSFDDMYRSLPMADDDLASFAGFKEKMSNRIVTKEASDQRLIATRCIVNAVLYIHSLEPNIDHLRPAGNLSHGDRRKLRASGKHVNLCTLPVIAVNWSYRRERVFGVDETWRREHSRWQRCGPQFSQIKLITIKGHKVVYKNTRENNEKFATR